MTTKIIKSNVTISTNNNGNLIENTLNMHYDNKNNNMIINYDNNELPKQVEIEINDMNNVLKELNLQSNPETLIKRLQNDFISKMKENVSEHESKLVSKHLHPKIELVNTKQTKKNKNKNVVKQNKNSKKNVKPKTKPIKNPKKPNKKSTTKKVKSTKSSNAKKNPTKKR